MLVYRLEEGIGRFVPLDKFRFLPRLSTVTGQNGQEDTDHVYSAFTLEIALSIDSMLNII